MKKVIEDKNNLKIKTKSKILVLGLMLVVLVGMFVPTHFAYAGLISWATGINFPSTELLVNGIAGAFAQGLLYLMSWVTGISGLLLNFVLKYTIVDMKTNLAGLTGINTAWKVIRDIMNIAFIFLLVYEGILMIIGQSSVEKVRKFIVAIVIASLLVNFSLFFTKVLIDASNIVTIGVYNSLLPPNPIPTDLNYGLSNAFTSKLQITSLYSTKANSDLGGQTGLGGIIIFTVGSAIILLVSAFVFFAIACMFVIRYITLIILLMLSPIAYMGSVIPGFGTYSRQWWESLKGQLLFAPIYMIMTSVILTLMGSSKFLVNGAEFAKALANNGGTPPTDATLGLILNFAVIIGLLIASLVIAKSASTKGSSLIGKATGNLTAFAGGAVMGGVAAVGRRTVGAQANKMANDKDLQDRAAAGDLKAQAKLKTYRGIAASSFDARRSRVGEMTATATGVSLGKGTEGIPFMGNAKAGQGGYTQIVKDKEAKEKKYMESLKPSDEQEAQHRAEAKETLESKEFKEREEAERKKLFDSEEAKAKLAKEKRPHEEVKVAAEKEKAEAEKRVSRAEAENKRLKDEYEKVLREESRPGGNTNRVNEALKAAETQKSLLKTEQDTLQQKINAHKKAEDAITEIEKKASDARKNWQSEEHKNLILDSKKAEEGGRTLYQKRGDDYASTFDEKAKRPWRNTQTNKTAASAVRKASKGKSPEEQLEELAKKMAKKRKADRKAAGIPEPVDEEAEEVAPAATPTTPEPPTTPPGTTTP